MGKEENGTCGTMNDEGGQPTVSDRDRIIANQKIERIKCRGASEKWAMSMVNGLSHPQCDINGSLELPLPAAIRTHWDSAPIPYTSGGVVPTSIRASTPRWAQWNSDRPLSLAIVIQRYWASCTLMKDWPEPAMKKIYSAEYYLQL
jgi:hypothetical protein